MKLVDLDLMFMVLIIGVFVSLISPLLLYHPHTSILVGLSLASVGIVLCILFRKHAASKGKDDVVQRRRREQIRRRVFRLGCVLATGGGVTVLFALKVLTQEARQ